MIKRLKSHENSLKIKAALRFCFRFSKFYAVNRLFSVLGQLSGIVQNDQATNKRAV